MITKPTSSNLTKDRILEKAEALFAQKGYHGVSVREITAAAKCNFDIMSIFGIVMYLNY